MRWMNLEPIIQSEVSQKEKYKYHILIHIYGGIDLENRLTDMREGQKERVCMQRVTWKFTLPYVNYIANGNLLYGSGNSNRGSVTI